MRIVAAWVYKGKNKQVRTYFAQQNLGDVDLQPYAAGFVRTYANFTGWFPDSVLTRAVHLCCVIVLCCVVCAPCLHRRAVSVQ